VMPVLWFIAGALSAALQSLTWWWTVALLGPRSGQRVLLLVWAGVVLRSALVAAVVAAAADRGLPLVAWTVAGFGLGHLTLTRMIWQRLAKRKPVMQT